MEASLTCAVCLGVFREPVTLPLCSHNFCKSCVQECAEPQLRAINFNILDGSVSVPVRVNCPLCRKVSAIQGGVSALPINTTLAELARLLPQTGSKDQGAECLYRDRGAAAADYCPDHPEYKLELFCKNCAQSCCGKCVSASHQGIFHNVNLLDMVYQEEKLMFFNSSKKLREVYEKFTKEMSNDDRDVKDALKKNTDMVNSAFDDVQKALELKRQQLLDFIKQQQSTAIKHYEVRKKTKAHHKITLENLLKDCESLVDEYEPKCFLKVSCRLNKRMKSNLDLVELTASHFQDIQKPDLDHVDLQAVLDAISTLQISGNASNETLPKVSEAVPFKQLTRTWKPEQAPTEKYCPVQNQELYYLQGQIQKMAIRLLSITEMPEYKHLSFEELRMKYYENSTIQENDESFPGQREQTPNAEGGHHLGTVEIKRLKNPKVKRAAGFFRGCSLVPIHGTNSASKSDLCPGSQKKVQTGSVFDLPSVSAVGVQVPSSSSGGASCGMSTDVHSKNPTLGVQETNLIAPSFCFGRSDATSVTKPIKNGKSLKKPKTAALLPVTENAEPLKSPFTANKIFIFSNTVDSNETNVTNPFTNLFNRQEPATRGNEAIEDHTTQSNSSEEFYDAVSNENSDVEDTEEPDRSSDNQDELPQQQDS